MNQNVKITYNEFIVRAGMMAFAEFPNLTYCLEYLATDDKEPDNIRELAFSALKKRSIYHESLERKINSNNGLRTIPGT